MDFIGIRPCKVELSISLVLVKPIDEGFTMCKYGNYAMVRCKKITTTQQCGRENIGK
jgi:hypothetical protein